MPALLEFSVTNLVASTSQSCADYGRFEADLLPIDGRLVLTATSGYTQKYNPISLPFLS
jgi:hypothetical protein